jgi:zinc protease
LTALPGKDARIDRSRGPLIANHNCGMLRPLLLCALLLSHARAAELTIPFVKYKLQNGLTVLLTEDHRLPLVAVNVWYNASPANEPPRRSGFAHLFEHMMFKGSLHVGDKQHIRLLEENGVTLYNATTGFDSTNYFETLPANQLALGLWLEADRMGFLTDTLTIEKLDNQREVVRNERRETTEAVPYEPSEDAVVKALFPPDHPYHGNVIGSHEDLRAATLEDVVRFHHEFYAPANAVLAVGGDFDQAAARALIEKYFGGLPGGHRVERPKPPLPSPSAARVVVREPVSLPRVAMAWITPPVYADGEPELDLAARVLGAGRASRLYKHLVRERGLATDVRCRLDGLALASQLECWAIGRPGAAPAALEAALAREIDALRAQPVTAAELERAKRGLLAEQVGQLQQLGGFGGKTDLLQQYEHYLGNPDYLHTDLARREAVTAAELQAAVARWLVDEHRVTVITKPREIQ